MLQLKKTVVAVVLGLGCVGFAQAAAGGYWGSFDGVLTFNNSLFAEGTYQDDSFSGNMDGFWLTFTVDPSVFSADTTASVVFKNTAGTLDTLTVTLFQGANTTDNPSDPSLMVGSPTTATGGDSVFATFSFIPGVTEYTIMLSGFAQGNGKWEIGLTAQAVPEPETYAMLLAGLGVVGMVARRRKMHVN